MFSSEEFSKKRRKRINARSVLGQCIHTCRAHYNDHEGQGFDEGKRLLCQLLGYRFYGQLMDAHVGRGNQEPNPAIDRALDIIIQHGYAGFLMLWLGREDENGRAA